MAIVYRSHGFGFVCTKCKDTVFHTSLDPPPGLCDMCSVAFNWRGCGLCGGRGSLAEPGDPYAQPCPACMGPAKPDEERCEHVLSDQRCRLRKGHWAWPSPMAINGHNFTKEHP